MPAARAVAIALVMALVGAAAGYWIAHERYAPPPPRKVRTDISGSELAARVQRALTHTDRVRGVGELAQILSESPPEALPDIRAGFESVFLDVAELEVVLLAEWWAAFDPTAAFQWTQATRIANQTLVVRSVVRAWARRDPKAASEAVGMLLDPIAKRACLDALVAGWDESGEGGLIEYLRSLPPSVEQLRALTAMARRRVLGEGPDAAFAWVESLPDDAPEEANRFKLQLFRRVTSAAASVDLQKTAAWAVKHADGPNGDGLLGRVGNTWTMTDGAAAMAWLASLPPSPARDRGVDDTYRAWLGWHPAEAIAWMASAPQEPWLEPAAPLYAVAVAKDDPVQGMAWAQRIRDPEQREAAIITIAGLWRRSAPEAMNAWLDSSDLPEHVREQILVPDPPPRWQPKGPDLDALAPGAQLPPSLPVPP